MNERQKRVVGLAVARVSVGAYCLLVQGLPVKFSSGRKFAESLLILVGLCALIAPLWWVSGPPAARADLPAVRRLRVGAAVVLLGGLATWVAIGLAHRTLPEVGPWPIVIVGVAFAAVSTAEYLEAGMPMAPPLRTRSGFNMSPVQAVALLVVWLAVAAAAGYGLGTVLNR